MLTFVKPDDVLFGASVLWSTLGQDTEGMTVEMERMINRKRGSALIDENDLQCLNKNRSSISHTPKFNLDHGMTYDTLNI